MRWTSFVALAALVGCGDKDTDTSGAGMQDADGDGFVAMDDCDDADAAVNPDAVEVCDGVDNDCDGRSDNATEGLSTFYVDADGDGFGNASSGFDACNAPSGYVADNTDCEDGDATAYPGAPELCDFVDNDCNGLVDDNATDAIAYYYDQDGDGYGTDKTELVACSAPANYTDAGGDCDDTNDLLSPGTPEICDEIDNNCNDEIDEQGAVDGDTYYTDADGDGFGNNDSAVLACAAVKGLTRIGYDCDDKNADVNPGASEVCDFTDNNCNDEIDEGVEETFYADGDGDGYGTTSSTTTGCEAISGYADADGDCDDTDDKVNPGALDFFNDGTDMDCDGSDGATQKLNNLDVIIGGDSGGLLGYAVEVCDIDNDGFQDLIVTSPFDSSYSSYAGGAFVYYGSNATLWTDDMTLSDADTVIRPSGTFHGFSLACADFNGDGYDDVAVATGEIDYYTTYQTDFEIYLFEGSSKAFGASVTESDAVGSIIQEVGVPIETPSVYSIPVWAGDADGDGDAELFVNMADGDGTYSYADGDIWVVDPGAVSSLEEDMIDYLVDSITPDTADAVTDLQVLDDYDGDGASDVLIGQGYYFDAEAEESPGLLSWINGTDSAAIADLATASLLGTEDGAAFGYASVVGDFNGDGLMDLVAGEPGASTKLLTTAGSLYVYADFVNELSGADLDAEFFADATVTGGYDSGLLGTGLARTVDFDLDGGDDLFVFEQYGGSNGYGMVYAVSGGDLSSTGLAMEDIRLLEWEGPNSSTAIDQDHAVGDIDGDGYDDMVVSGINGSDGTVWVLLSSNLGL